MTHSHEHGIHQQRSRLIAALCVTASILAAEVVGAIITRSLALLVDAGHMLVDAGGLTIALIATLVAARPATNRRTWGFRRAEVLAASAQAAVLLAVGVFVVIESIQRLFAPPEIPSAELLIFGIIGLLGNTVSIVILSHQRSTNLNLRAAFLEVMSDALGSVAVIVAALVIALTGWSGADSLAALLIGLFILPRSYRLLRESANVLLESTPPGLDLDAVRAHIIALPDVLDVHDLHASQIATDLPVLSAHVIVTPDSFQNGRLPELLTSLQKCVATHFAVSIEHSTFQLEPPAHRRNENTQHN